MSTHRRAAEASRGAASAYCSLVVFLMCTVAGGARANAQCNVRQEILGRGPASSELVVFYDQSVDQTVAIQGLLRGSEGIARHLYRIVQAAGVRWDQVGPIVTFAEHGQEQLVAFYVPVPASSLRPASEGHSRTVPLCGGTVYVASRTATRVAAFRNSASSSFPWVAPLIDGDAVGGFWATHAGSVAERVQGNIVRAVGDAAPPDRVRSWLALSQLERVSGRLFSDDTGFRMEVHATYRGTPPNYAPALFRLVGVNATFRVRANDLQISIPNLTAAEIIRAVQRFP